MLNRPRWVLLVILPCRKEGLRKTRVVEPLDDRVIGRPSDPERDDIILPCQVSSTGQRFPAMFRSFSASLLRIRSGIDNSRPRVKITYSKNQPLYLRTLTSPHGIKIASSLTRTTNLLDTPKSPPST